jgi:Acetyltransferase (GNAT) domain
MKTTPTSWTVRERVDVISPAPRDFWRAALLADPDALVSHTPEWIDVICAVDGWMDTSRLYMWPSGHHLVLPMVAKRIGNINVVEESLPQGWGFGGLVGAEITPEQVATVYEDLEKQRHIRLRVCPNPLQGGAWAYGIAQGRRGAIAIPCRAHAVDLGGGADAVWKRFSDNARRGIRKAEKQSLEVECDTTGRLLGVFEDLWLRSVQRWARQQRRPTWFVRLRGNRLNPRTRWQQIAERTAGGATIWVARHRGEAVAAIVVMQGPNDHYTRGAMHMELAGPTRANFMLHWLAIQDACRRRARWYQMGQSGWGNGQLARFKENFGAQPYDFPDLRLEAFPITRMSRLALSALKGPSEKLMSALSDLPRA